MKTYHKPSTVIIPIATEAMLAGSNIGVSSTGTDAGASFAPGQEDLLDE